MASVIERCSVSRSIAKSNVSPATSPAGSSHAASVNCPASHVNASGSRRCWTSAASNSGTDRWPHSKRSVNRRPCVRASTSLAPWPSRISARPLRSATNNDTPDAPNVSARRSPRTSAAATGGAFSTAKSSSARSSCALRRSAIEPAYGAAAPGKESQTVAWRGAAARWPPPVRLGDLGVGELSLGGLEHAGAGLVGTLVGAHGLDAILVGLAERGLNVAGGELVIARPRLVAPQRADASQHGRAVLVAALVGIDLGEIDLRQLGELADDLVRRELVIARDRQVRLGGDGALGLALGLRDARDLAGLARRALRRRARLARRAGGGLAGRTHAVSGARLGHVIGRVVLDVGADDGLGELGQLTHDALEHLLLVLADRGRQFRGLPVADQARELLQRRVGRDLQRLGSAGVLGVLEHLLLAARTADEIDGRLGQRERLTDHRLGEAAEDLQRVAALPQLAQSLLHALGVIARLAQVLLKPTAVAPPRGHRDLGLQHAHERHLGGVRFVEVLHDLLLGWTHEVGLRPL